MTNLIPRPAPDDPTPSGIAYLCDGRKEVSVVYAKNRASVTLDGKTWRMEYQPTGTGFRYMDTANEWTGSDDSRHPARIWRQRPAARLQLPAAAADDVTVMTPVTSART